MRSLFSSRPTTTPVKIAADPALGPAAFEAYYDPVLHRIFAHGSGFWTLADSAYFLRRLAEVIDAATRAGGGFTFLADFANSPVQAPAVSEANAPAAAIVVRSPVRKCAVVTSTTLKAMQLKRQISDPRVAFFDTPTSALRWLDDHWN